jgi:hypothetical protein
MTVHRRTATFGPRGSLSFRICLAAVIGLLAIPALASAASITVNDTADPGAPGGTCTLREAIASADAIAPTLNGCANGAGDDVITFALATPATIGLVGGQLPMITGAGGQLTITGPGSGLLTVSGNHASRVLETAAGSTTSINGLTIADGRVVGADGGLHTNGGDGLGGGISNGGTMTLTGVVLSGNDAGGGSGGDGDPGGLNFADRAGGAGGTGGGGGIYNLGTLTIQASTFTHNDANGGIGGTSVSGGIRTTPPDSGDGGPGRGGAIFNGGTVTIGNSTLTLNSARGGDGVQGGSAATGVFGADGGDASDGLGGAVYSAGQTTLNSSTLSSNDALAGFAGPAGLGDGNAQDMNGAPGSEGNGVGGGVEHVAAQLLAITNSTISGNNANTDPFYPGVGFGGGIATAGTAPMSATHVTLVDNAARNGGDNLGTVDGAVTLRATIIASRAAGSPALSCLYGASVVTSGGFNLDDGTSCGFGPGTDLVGVEPQLGALANNGGPTLTHLPAAGSPVVDAVIAACPPPANDQRGMARAANSCDIGAVERQPGDAEPGTGGSPPATPPPAAAPTAATGLRAAALKKCKKKKGKKRKKCRKKAAKLPT